MQPTASLAATRLASRRLTRRSFGGLIVRIGESDGLDVEEISARGGITGFPALFVSGEKSDYIRAEDHQMIRSVFPSAQVVTIPSAGHWLHAEQPALLVKNIRYFLDS